MVAFCQSWLRPFTIVTEIRQLLDYQLGCQTKSTNSFSRGTAQPPFRSRLQPQRDPARRENRILETTMELVPGSNQRREGPSVSWVFTNSTTPTSRDPGDRSLESLNPRLSANGWSTSKTWDHHMGLSPYHRQNPQARGKDLVESNVPMLPVFRGKGGHMGRRKQRRACVREPISARGR